MQKKKWDFGREYTDSLDYCEQYWDFLGSDCKESFCNVGDPGLISEWGRSSGGGNGNPLQYSCLENPMDKGAWQVIVHEVTKSWT